MASEVKKKGDNSLLVDDDRENGQLLQDVLGKRDRVSRRDRYSGAEAPRE